MQRPYLSYEPVPEEIVFSTPNFASLPDSRPRGRVLGFQAEAQDRASARALKRALCCSGTALNHGSAASALSVASALDEASRFRRSSSVGAYLGLTHRRNESGATSRNGRIPKQGDVMTQKHLYEAATTLLTRNLRFSTLKAWGLKAGKGIGVQEGPDRRCQEDGSHSPRHVEDQQPIPLEPSGMNIVMPFG